MRAFAAPGAKVCVKAGHGVGKTTLMAILAIWHTLLFPDSKAAATAPTASQLRDVLMAEVGKQLRSAHGFVKEHLESSTMRLSFKGRETTQFLTARTARPEDPSALQGLHATHMAYFIDEAFGVADPIFEVARGAMSTEGARVLMCGNPTATSGYAYNAFHRNAEMWKCFTLSCVDSPLVTRQYIQEMEKEYGIDSDVFKVRVLGQFPSAAICQFIPTDVVDAALGRFAHRMQYDYAPVVLGVDVAWFGDDRSVIFLRQGLRASMLWQGYNIDTMTFAGLVAQYQDEHKAQAVFVDATGVGAGVVDRLRQMGRTPIAVMLGGRAIQSKYRNKRANVWGDMKEWLQAGGCIPKDDGLREDLINVQYGFTIDGKVQLERKEDMKKRGLASPDLADALALTFSEPLVKLTPLEEVKGETNRVQTEYELFA